MKNLILIVALFIMCSFTACKSGEPLIIDDNEESFIFDEGSFNSDKTVNSDYSKRSDNNKKIAEDQIGLAEDRSDSMLSFVVYVCGAVNNPGVYKLNENARVLEAIEAAGGFRGDAGIDYLNLAKTVSDGEKIYVPTELEIEKGQISDGSNIQGSSVANSNGSSLQGSKININTATETELTSIPGVGPSKAKTIISYREQNGRFQKIEDIMNITGIKEGLFNKVKDYICVN